jgi:hypothetical protein
MHRVVLAGAALHDENVAPLVLHPIEFSLGTDKVGNVTSIAERAVIDTIIDEVTLVEVGLVCHEDPLFQLTTGLAILKNWMETCAESALTES